MRISQKSLLLVIAALSGATAQAGGLEKTVTWSGKYVGVGGAAASWATGAESLYFNPAGLSMKTGEHGDVSLNFSPTLANFSGPISTANTSVDSKTGFSPVFGALASYHINDQLGLGIGYYVSGGTHAEYDSVQRNVAGAPRSELAVTELALGAGYEVMPGLRLGASWRILHVKGDLDSFASANAFVQNSDLSKTNVGGFKLGAQYQAPDKMWGVGATFRNGVGFTATDTQTLNTPVTTTSAAGSVHASFPWQASIGGNYQVSNAWRAHLEYSFTNYSAISQIDFTGLVPASSPVRWKDQSNYKLGVEYTGLSAITLRGGYVYTTPVVPAGTASATFSSPGAGHTITVGAGKILADNMFELNGALEYSMAKGDADAASGNPFPGTYKSHAWGLHLSGNYNF